MFQFTKSLFTSIVHSEKNKCKGRIFCTSMEHCVWVYISLCANRLRIPPKDKLTQLVSQRPPCTNYLAQVLKEIRLTSTMHLHVPLLHSEVS